MLINNSLINFDFQAFKGATLEIILIFTAIFGFFMTIQGIVLSRILNKTLSSILENTEKILEKIDKA